MAAVNRENTDNITSWTARSSGVAECVSSVMFNENDPLVGLQDAYTLEEQCSASLSRLCNIHIHNLASPMCQHISERSAYPNQCITFIYSISSSWNICLVPQYSRHLGLRLVPYAWTCRPVQMSKFFRLQLVVPSSPNRTCPTLDQHRGDTSDEKPSTAETIQNKSSFDSNTQPDESSGSPAASVINVEASKLADEAWVPDTTENWKNFNNPPREGIHECDLHGANESDSWNKCPAMSTVDECVDLLSSGVASCTVQHNCIMSDAIEETDENRMPNSPQKQFENIVVDVDAKIKRKSESIVDGCLVEKPFTEPDIPQHKPYELTKNKSLFLSPVASLHCNLRHPRSRDEPCVENLMDLLGTSTSLEDHVNDFTDLLGREFDELFATYSDLCTASSQKTVEMGSSDVVSTEKESFEENCSVSPHLWSREI